VRHYTSSVSYIFHRQQTQGVIVKEWLLFLNRSWNFWEIFSNNCPKIHTVGVFMACPAFRKDYCYYSNSTASYSRAMEASQPLHRLQAKWTTNIEYGKAESIIWSSVHHHEVPEVKNWKVISYLWTHYPIHSKWGSVVSGASLKIQHILLILSTYPLVCFTKPAISVITIQTFITINTSYHHDNREQLNCYQSFGAC
jgi:hypothetical protein